MTILLPKSAALLFTTYCLASQHNVHAMMVGDEVCITGYIMDNFCIERGTLLDNGSVMTLQGPEKHSFHCLLDVPICYNSGFSVLGDKDPTTDLHCVGFRLDDTDAVLEAGRATGICSNCVSANAAAPRNGYRATVKGTVKQLGDDSDGLTGTTPMLTDLEMLDASVGCDGIPTIPPLCARSIEPIITEEPTSAPVGTPVGPVQSCPDSLDKSTVIDAKATLYFAMVPSNPPGSGNGLLCGRLEAENDGWLGFAISEDGNMLGSVAIIGQPDDDAVQKYDLYKYGATPMPLEKQTLRDTSIFDEDGKTIMEFTKLLVEDGENPIFEEGENIFLHARGVGSALGYHTNGRLSFSLDFSATESPTPLPSTSPKVASANPTMSPITLSPSKSPTKSPTGSPITTSVTSTAPTPLPSTSAKVASANPTMSPITLSPSKSPKSTSPKVASANPTMSPITLSPSKPPTKSPTGSPITTAPAPLPSASPQVASSASPTTSLLIETLTTSPTGSPSTSALTDNPVSVVVTTANPTVVEVEVDVDVSANEEPLDISGSGTPKSGLVALFAGVVVALSVFLS